MTWKNWMLGAVLTVAPAFAQTTFNVPFDFDINGTQWGAGSYQVTPLATGVVLIRNLDTQKNKMVLTVPDRSAVTDPNHDGLTFHQYGESYFLSLISFGKDRGLRLSRTTRERELASRIGPQVASIRSGVR